MGGRLSADEVHVGACSCLDVCVLGKRRSFLQCGDLDGLGLQVLNGLHDCMTA